MTIYCLCNGAAYAAMQRATDKPGGYIAFGKTAAEAEQRCKAIMLRDTPVQRRSVEGPYRRMSVVRS